MQAGKYRLAMYLCRMEDRIYIKNMVCPRCIKVIGEVLDRLQISAKSIQLGEVILAQPLNAGLRSQLAGALAREGFELLDDQDSQLVSKIKSTLIALIHQEDLSVMREKISHYLAHKLHKDYSALSHLFSESENTTIEQFVILQKIEKVKELLAYGEHNLGEIALQMGYSSTAHLSAQFKKITGFTPTRFKQLKNHRRRALDDF